MADAAIRVTDLAVRYGQVAALDGVDLSVPRGSVHGLLGHNGAGKSTLVNVLATLVHPTSGTAAVAGHDVVRAGRRVRRLIGIAGQTTAVEEWLSARENLVLFARLFGAGPREARTRADLLIDVFDLGEVAGRPVHTCSGGMRRRIDLAVSVVGGPEVLFLDEPTTGLDPVARLAVWDVVRALADREVTVLLTTQYLEEADRLADSVTVLAAGRVVATGSPADLKARYGRRTLRMRFSSTTDAGLARRAVTGTGLTCAVHGVVLTVVVTASRDLVEVVRRLDLAGVETVELTLTEPDLDESYLALIGEPALGSPTGRSTPCP